MSAFGHALAILIRFQAHVLVFVLKPRNSRILSIRHTTAINTRFSPSSCASLLALMLYFNRGTAGGVFETDRRFGHGEGQWYTGCCRGCCPVRSLGRVAHGEVYMCRPLECLALWSSKRTHTWWVFACGKFSSSLARWCPCSEFNGLSSHGDI